MKKVYKQSIIEIVEIEEDFVRTSQEGSGNGGTSGGTGDDELPLIPF